MTHALYVEEFDPTYDRLALEHNRKYAEESVVSRTPKKYRNAEISVPEVTAWVSGLISGALESRDAGMGPKLSTGSSLMLIGSVGSGKTWQCFAAIRSLAKSGVICDWHRITAPDLFANLRPGGYENPEQEFARLRDMPLLVLDDLGAEKVSEWTEEYLCRLVNHRWEWELPTLFTSNVPPKLFTERFGRRVTSRLLGMATQVVMNGPDRRAAS